MNLIINDVCEDVDVYYCGRFLLFICHSIEHEMSLQVHNRLDPTSMHVFRLIDS